MISSTQQIENNLDFVQNNNPKNNKDKLDKLGYYKTYSIENVCKDLMKAHNLLPDDYINENLVTKKFLQQKIDQIQNCSTKVIQLKSKNVNTETGVIGSKDNTEVYFGNACNQYLVCPICAKKRSQILKARYGSKISEETNKYKYAYMLNFTVQDAKGFNTAYKLLQDTIRAWRLQGQKRENGYSKGESSKILSALGVNEVKEGKNSKEWHIHSHYLVFTNEQIDFSLYDKVKKKEIIDYFKKKYRRKPNKKELSPAYKMQVQFQGNEAPVSKLSLQWLVASKNTSLNIKCIPQKKFKDSAGNTELYYIDSEGNKKLTKNELLKYVSKVNELSGDKLLTLLSYKDKKRFLTTWGSMRDYKYDPEIKEEIVLHFKEKHNRKPTIEELKPALIISEDDTIVDSEHNMKVDYLDAVVYNYEQSAYTDESSLSDRDLELILELKDKKERLLDFRIELNKSRRLFNQFKNHLIDILTIKGTESPQTRQELIYDANSLRQGYRVYRETLFRKRVDVLKLRNNRLIPKMLNKTARYYYKEFLKFSELLKL